MVAKNGNNVEATFDFVEWTIFFDIHYRHCCRFGNKVECCFDKVERCFDIVAGCRRGFTQCVCVCVCVCLK